MNSAVKEYWEQRARHAAEHPTATTDDIHLRELEIRTLVNAIRSFDLPAGSLILDVGCGDGFSTVRVAAELSEFRFVGIDYSQNMIATAQRRQAAEKPPAGAAVDFRVSDALTVGSLFLPNLVDVVMTDRCLINLDSSAVQYEVIRQIQSLLKPGGRYLAIENFGGGQEELNRARAAMGLKEIPVRWHNLFFREEEFLVNTRAWFRQVEINNFSSAYYYATRVIYSKYCQMRGEEPDYCHEIHQLAVQLPPMGSFSPIKLAILTK